MPNTAPKGRKRVIISNRRWAEITAHLYVEGDTERERTVARVMFLNRHVTRRWDFMHKWAGGWVIHCHGRKAEGQARCGVWVVGSAVVYVLNCCFHFLSELGQRVIGRD